MFSLSVQEMENSTKAKSCNCPVACNSNSYSYSVSSIPFDIEALCKREEEVFGGTKYALPPAFMRNYETFVRGRAMGAAENCHESLKEMAFVNFQLVAQTATQIRREVRVSFADQISSFGNIKNVC